MTAPNMTSAALRDAVKGASGARGFATGLHEFLHGRGFDEAKLTVFGFPAQPEKHFFLKPNVTRIAAKEYEFDFEYKSKPNWSTYTSLLAFGEQVQKDQCDLKPQDMIDLQSFMWVQGSDEYEE